MSKKYEKPPIIEVVCEFRLTSEATWDITIPGLIYEKVNAEFPDKKARTIQEVRTTKDKGGTGYQVQAQQRVLFLTKDGKVFIQVGPHLFAVNCLEPYPGWANFRPKVESSFEALIKTINISTFQRIGLRYINRIEVPDHSFDLEDYFEFRPYLGRNLPEDFTDFIIGCYFPCADGRDSCRVQMSKAESSSDKFVLTLDLDYFLAQPETVKVTEALAWVDKAHLKIAELFEGCIKDSLREIFKEVT